MQCDIFISYSNEDKEWVQGLIRHLTPMIKEYAIKIWDDASIPRNKYWRNDLEQSLHASRVAVFLVSPAFLESPLFPADEPAVVLKRAEAHNNNIRWIAARPCALEHPFTIYPPLNNPDQPLVNFSGEELDQELLRISEKIAAESRRTITASQTEETYQSSSSRPNLTEPLPLLSEDDRLELLRDLGFSEVESVDADGGVVPADPGDLDKDFLETQEIRFEGYLRHLMQNERFLMFFKEMVKVTDPTKVKDMGEKLGITQEWMDAIEHPAKLTGPEDSSAKVEFEEGLRHFDSSTTLVLNIGPHADPIRIGFEGDEKVIIGQARDDQRPDFDLGPYLDKPYGVSRQHIQLWREDNHLNIRDMNSLNHTYINGQFLRPGQAYVVQSGDKIRLGALLLVAYFDPA